MSEPLVSVIIPTYNGEKYLEEALLSVFGQTYKNYEVIVVNDGSRTDGAAKICKKYQSRLKYIRQENRGVSAARNAGIKMSLGDYVAFLDEDDTWLPEKLDRQLRYFEELRTRKINPGFIYTGYYYMLEHGEIVSKTLYRAAGNHYRTLLFLNIVGPPSSMLVPRLVLDQVGFFDEELKNVEDWELCLRIARHYPVYSLDEYLVRYRSRPGSLYKNSELMALDLELFLKKLIMIEPQSGALGHSEMRKLIRWHRSEIARFWKQAAYDRLFERGDGDAFRSWMRRSFRNSLSCFGFKVLVYYLLSFVSVPLCQWIKRDNQRDVPQQYSDNIYDAKNLEF